MTLTAVSLFAGVGGFDLAMQRNGIDVVAAVEIDDKARAVLARRFPDTRLFPDVTKVSAHDLRDAGFVPDRGIITGGFPCQDLSVAGRRKGLAGERSGLFWHIIRLVDELHPRWIVLENVPGLLSSEGGRDMGIVLGALGDSGYGVAYRVLDAQHFGVPQRRRRVFIVAGRRAGTADSTGPVQILLEPEGSAGNPAARRTAGQEVAGTLGGGAGSRGWAPDTDRMTFVPVVRAFTVAEQANGFAWESNVYPTLTAQVPNDTSNLQQGIRIERESSAPGEQQPDADGGEHRDDRDGPADGPRYRVTGRDVMSTIPASIYHHGNAVHQDVMAGHLVVVDE